MLKSRNVEKKCWNTSDVPGEHIRVDKGENSKDRVDFLKNKPHVVYENLKNSNKK